MHTDEKMTKEELIRRIDHILELTRAISEDVNHSQILRNEIKMMYKTYLGELKKTGVDIQSAEKCVASGKMCRAENETFPVLIVLIIL